jgi:hypothetical protein
MFAFPLPVVELRRLEAILDDIEASFGKYGVYFADNLLTVGRNLGFLDDPDFRDAMTTPDPARAYAGLAWRLHVLCWAAEQGMRQTGDLVECGVLEGFSMDVVARYHKLETLDRSLYLYDLFDGAGGEGRGISMPQHDCDLAWRVQQRFQRYDRVKVIAGCVPDSFAIAVPERIAFLHIDLNDASAETAAIDHLWDRLSSGAFIVWDDFGWSTYQDQFLAAKQAMAKRGVAILELPTGQGLAIKP